MLTDKTADKAPAAGPAESGSSIWRLFSFSRIAAVGALLVVNDSPAPGPRESFSEMSFRAGRELKEHGVTTEQRRAYVAGLTELVHRAVHPIAIIPAESTGWSTLAQNYFTKFVEGRNEKLNPGEEDAWRLYLGLPQAHGTFEISAHRPSRGKDLTYYFKFADHKKEFSFYLNDPEGLRNPDMVRKLVEATREGPRYNSGKRGDPIPHSMVMHNYSWSSGRDEQGCYIAYYDKYDFSLPLNAQSMIGRPFEIYDRLYYDPATFTLLEKRP